MDKNWIIVTNPVDSLDVMINLQFVSKVVLDNTNFRVVFYQGVGGTGTSGSTQALTFPDAPTAAAFHKQVFSTMDKLEIINDLRPQV